MFLLTQFHTIVAHLNKVIFKSENFTLLERRYRCTSSQQSLARGFD